MKLIFTIINYIIIKLKKIMIKLIYTIINYIIIKVIMKEIKIFIRIVQKLILIILFLKVKKINNWIFHQQNIIQIYMNKINYLKLIINKLKKQYFITKKMRKINKINKKNKKHFKKKKIKS